MAHILERFLIHPAGGATVYLISYFALRYAKRWKWYERTGLYRHRLVGDGKRGHGGIVIAMRRSEFNPGDLVRALIDSATVKHGDVFIVTAVDSKHIFCKRPTGEHRVWFKPHEIEPAE